MYHKFKCELTIPFPIEYKNTISISVAESYLREFLFNKCSQPNSVILQYWSTLHMTIIATAFLSEDEIIICKLHGIGVKKLARFFLSNPT